MSSVVRRRDLGFSFRVASRGRVRQGHLLFYVWMQRVPRRPR